VQVTPAITPRLFEEGDRMTTIDKFARAWGKVDWQGTPGDLFADGGTLLIGIADTARTRCQVAWLDAAGHWWFIDQLPLRTDGHLAQDRIDVRCEATDQRHETCVDMWIEEDSSTFTISLQGSLQTPKSSPPNEGPVGTFIAEANGAPCLDATRLEESLAV